MGNKMRSNSFWEEDTVYTRTGRERRVYNDEMQGWEDGFMEGYEFDEAFDELL